MILLRLIHAFAGKMFRYPTYGGKREVTLGQMYIASFLLLLLAVLCGAVAIGLGYLTYIAPLGVQIGIGSALGVIGGIMASIRWAWKNGRL